jgi:hypothetical protein
MLTIRKIGIGRTLKNIVYNKYIYEGIIHILKFNNLHLSIS